MNIKLPPRYIPLPTEIAYSKESPAIKDTFTKIFGLAWEMDYKNTPSLPVNDLIDFLCLARRTYFLHIEKLIELSWLRSETPRTGCVRFSFPLAVFTADEFSAKSCTKVQKVALDEEEDDLNLINDSSSSSSLSENSAKNCTKNDGRFALLRAAGVYPTKIPIILQDKTLTVEDILAELAHCYDPASGVSKPSAILGMNLSAGYRPSAVYYGSVSHIPTAILARAGLASLIPAPELDYSISIDDEENSDERPESLDPSLEQIPPGSSMTPARAWDEATELLKNEMPKATFDNWIRNTRPERYDSQGILTVGVQSDYARDWLEGRLTSTAARILTGLLNRTMKVKFEKI